VLTTCPGLHSIAERPGFELATYWSQVQRPNHSATEPHSGTDPQKLQRKDPPPKVSACYPHLYTWYRGIKCYNFVFSSKSRSADSQFPNILEHSGSEFPNFATDSRYLMQPKRSSRYFSSTVLLANLTKSTQIHIHFSTSVSAPYGILDDHDVNDYGYNLALDYDYFR